MAIAHRGRRLSILVVLVAAAGLAPVAAVGYRAWRERATPPLAVLGTAPAFSLVDQLERPVRSDELRGAVVVANFVYTSCRDICPMLTTRMAALEGRLRREDLLADGRVRLLSFTVDPAHDTPVVLRAYAERHGADARDWRFLTGPPGEVLSAIVQGFRLGIVPATDHGAHGGGAAHGGGSGMPTPAEIAHSSRFVLIDGEGRIRAYYDGLDLDLDRVVADIRRLHG